MIHNMYKIIIIEPKFIKLLKRIKKRSSVYSLLKKIHLQSNYYKQNENFTVLIISLTHKI